LSKLDPDKPAVHETEVHVERTPKKT
jgi:hypothetical protein